MTDGIGERFNRVVDRIDDTQRATPPVAIAVAVAKKYGDDRGTHLARLLAYNGFFSMFPLMLASVSVLGLVLRDNPDLQKKLIDSALSAIPVLGTNISASDGFSGSGVVLVFSVALAFWAGLGLLDMLQEALNTVWNVPRFDRPGWIPRRARAAVGAIVILLCAALSGVGNYVLNTGLSDPWRSMIGAVFPFLAGMSASFALHKILCARKLSPREVLPAAIGTALGWWALFSLGNFYFNRVVKNASDTYGAFAVVLGLLSWSYLLGTMFVYATEIAAVLADRLWPRSLTGRRPGEADRRAMTLSATRNLSDRAADVSVDFTSTSETERAEVGSIVGDPTDDGTDNDPED